MSTNNKSRLKPKKPKKPPKKKEEVKKPLEELGGPFTEEDIDLDDVDEDKGVDQETGT